MFSFGFVLCWIPPETWYKDMNRYIIFFIRSTAISDYGLATQCNTYGDKVLGLCFHGSPFHHYCLENNNISSSTQQQQLLIISILRVRVCRNKKITISDSSFSRAQRGLLPVTTFSETQRDGWDGDLESQDGNDFKASGSCCYSSEPEPPVKDSQVAMAITRCERPGSGKRHVAMLLLLLNRHRWQLNCAKMCRWHR